MNESPAPTVSTSPVLRASQVATEPHVVQRIQGALAAAGDDREGRSEGAPVAQHVGDEPVRVEPRDVLVAGLDDVGERDERLHARTHLVGRAHQARPRVGVVGDGRGRAGLLHGDEGLRATGLEDGRDAAGVDVSVPRQVGDGRDLPGDVEVVGRRSTGVEDRAGDRGPDGAVATGDDLGTLLRAPVGDASAPVVPTEPGRQRHVVVEGAEPEGDVRRGPADVQLRWLAAPLDGVDEGLADDEDRGGRGGGVTHRVTGPRRGGRSRGGRTR